MKFEEGITYLKTVWVSTIDTGCLIMWAIFTILLMIICARYFYCRFSDASYTIGSLLKPEFIEVLVCIVVLSIILLLFTHLGIEKGYEVIIDDTVPYTKIIEKYNIISVDENVTTITKK